MKGNTNPSAGHLMGGINPESPLVNDMLCKKINGWFGRPFAFILLPFRGNVGVKGDPLY